jgi:hypothetical protein
MEALATHMKKPRRSQCGRLGGEAMLLFGHHGKLAGCLLGSVLSSDNRDLKVFFFLFDETGV